MPITHAPPTIPARRRAPTTPPMAASVAVDIPRVGAAAPDGDAVAEAVPTVLAIEGVL